MWDQDILGILTAVVLIALETNKTKRIRKTFATTFI
jgi:hypothetical protein